MEKEKVRAVANHSRRALTRRNFLKAAFGTGATLLFTGCGGGSTQPTAPAGGEATAKSIQLWTFLDPAGDDPRSRASGQIFDQFTGATNIDITTQIIPWQEIDTKLLAAIQAGNPPDVSRVRHFMFPRHMRAKSLTALTQFASQSYPDDEIQDFVVQFEEGGEIYAFLVENISNALYIRADWLEQVGMEEPKTWDDFIAVGKAFKELNPNAWGYLSFASTTQLNHTEQIFQPMIHGRGGKLLDENGHAAFNDDAGVETFTFLRDLVHQHKILSPDVVSMTYDQQTDAFIAGQAGMAIDGSHRYTRITENLGQEKVKVVRIPGPTADQSSPCMITGWLMAIPRGTENSEAAWKLIEYRLRPESQELWAKVAGGLPTRKSVTDRPFFQTDEAAIIKWWLSYEAENGELLVVPEKMSELNQVLAEAFQRVVLQPDDTIRDVLDEAAKQYNALL